MEQHPAEKQAAAPGTGLNHGLVHIFGHRDTLSLDARQRFRLPDQLVARLHEEMGRVAGESKLSPAALQRLAFYFVPGTDQRIFLYPAQNIETAISRFESPPAGEDPALVRAARDYFYSMMVFVEADRQNRLQIPEPLCEHAGMQEDERQVVLVAHNLWLSLARTQQAAEMAAVGREALDAVGPNVLDPVRTQPPSPRNDPEEA